MDLPKSGNPSLTPMPHAKPAALALSASILVSISGCLVPSHFSVVHSIVILGHSRDAVHRLPCISTCSSPPTIGSHPINLLTIYLPHGRFLLYTYPSASSVHPAIAPIFSLRSHPIASWA